MTTVLENINMSTKSKSDSDYSDSDNSYDLNTVRQFFVKNSAPDWKTFVTCSRCEGFTLSYGMFIRLDENKVAEMEKIISEDNDEDNDEEDDEEDDEEYDKEDDDEDEKKSKKNKKDNKHSNPVDQCKIMRQMLSNPDSNFIQVLCDKLQDQYPELVIYPLPCCWGDMAKLDFFVGFNIYPLLWTRRRHYVDTKEHRLCSMHDDFFGSKEKKDKLVQQYEEAGYKLYEAPDFLETEYIFDFYCNADSWKTTLYPKNYDRIKHWIPMLNDLYKDVIFLKTIFLKKFIAENRLLFSNETKEPNFEWCFLPSDCASCS